MKKSKFQETMMLFSTLIKLFPVTIKAFSRAAEKTMLEKRRQDQWEKMLKEVVDEIEEDR
jgi:hypothetical protein